MMKAPGRRLGLGVLGRYEHFEAMDGRGGDLMRGVLIGGPVGCLFAQSTRWWAGYESRSQNPEVEMVFTWKTGHTSTALKSFSTTVATPLKKPGRDLPSICSSRPLTCTKAPRCSATFVVIPDGYMSLTGGMNTADGFRTEDDRTPPSLNALGSLTSTATSRNFMRSLSSVLGYVARSS